MKNFRLFFPLMLLCTTWLFAQTPTPVPVQISERIENIGGTYYHLHTVEKGQTLYSISRTYQVTADEIKRTINKPEIQIDEILMIPVSSERLRTLLRNNLLPEAKPEIRQDIKPEKTDIVKPVDLIQEKFNNPLKTTLNVALMLPLHLNEVDQIRINSRDNAIPRPFRLISFYEGATLAAQAFEAENVKINVHVFDVPDDENSAASLINSGKLKNIDIIIGPLHLRPFRLMSDFAKQHGIFIINPISERDEILVDNPYVIKINPSEKNQLDALLRYVTKDQTKQQILVVSNDSLPNEKERSEQARLFFETHHSDFYTPVFVDISKNRFQTFSNLLSKTKRNAIIYLSNNPAFFTEILNQVPKRENSVEDVLFCLNRLSQFDHTEIQYLNNLQTHYTAPFFVDYNSERVRDFERLFFETYRTIPDNNAYMGYDVMNFVLTMLNIGNTNYGNYLETKTCKSFHNCIRLRRANPTQGLENQETNILKIEDGKLKRVNN
ncbi:MAG: ABC transporter substrate-binding protein [Bacteroidales bacterium]|jgi:LysM repeat protein/ABC-type branched-subunit amino acid transport system substrate-binding protein|nr:ABC transporter substrate-binding protein [Bacteroidales bacterium]